MPKEKKYKIPGKFEGPLFNVPDPFKHLAALVDVSDYKWHIVTAIVFVRRAPPEHYERFGDSTIINEASVYRDLDPEKYRALMQYYGKTKYVGVLIPPPEIEVDEKTKATNILNIVRFHKQHCHESEGCDVSTFFLLEDFERHMGRKATSEEISEFI